MQFVPFRVEMIYSRDKFEYIGTSPMFDQVEPGCIEPEYDFLIYDLGMNMKMACIRK